MTKAETSNGTVYQSEDVLEQSSTESTIPRISLLQVDRDPMFVSTTTSTTLRKRLGDNFIERQNCAEHGELRHRSGRLSIPLTVDNIGQSECPRDPGGQ